MKNIFFTICCVSSFCAFAQNGFYLKPQIGTGLSNVITTSAHNKSGVSCYSASLRVGYQMNNWVLESGIKYFTTGYINQGLLIAPPAPANEINFHSTDEKYTYTHIAIPLNVGYRIPLTKKLTLVPMAGVMAGYNSDCHVEIKEIDVTSDYSYSSDKFEKSYKRFNLWGSAMANLEYKAGSKIYVTAGLQADCMLNSMLVKEMSLYRERQQYNYAGTLNLGIRWNLGKVSNKATTGVTRMTSE